MVLHNTQTKTELLDFKKEFPELVNDLKANQDDRPLIIFTDVDGTILPTHSPNIDYAKYSKHLKDFFEYLKKEHDAIIIPITGTSWEKKVADNETPSVLERVNQNIIPSIPQAIAASGGKVVYCLAENGEYTESKLYTKSINSLGSEFLSRVNYEFFEAFIAANPNLNLYFQPKHFQGEEKKDISEIGGVHLYFETDNPSIFSKSLIPQLEALIKDIPNAKLVTCEERQHNDNPNSKTTKFCIDVTPTNKGSVIEFFMDYISIIDYRLPYVTYFGDAGNDFPAASNTYVDFVGIPSGASLELIDRESELEGKGKDVEILRNASDSPVLSLHKLFLKFCNGSF